MPTFEELKRRKLVQWALAYLAGAWVVVEVAQNLADTWGLSATLIQKLHVVLAVGLLVTLILAWYHGEKGQQRVSGPELLMIAGILGVAGIALTAVRAGPDAEGGTAAIASPGQSSADSIPFRSVAVLPLDNLSAAEEHGHLAGAMTEQITHALAQLPKVFVPIRNSAAKFEGSGQTIREFAGELGVAHVIVGSVQRVGDDVRVIVQLIDAATGEHVWSENYDSGLADLLDLQVEIAGQVAEKLASTLTERARERIRAGSTDNPEAFELFSRANEVIEGRNYVDASRLRMQLLREAVVHDPGFADAWAGLGASYYVLYFVESETAYRDSALAAFDRAIGLAEEPAYGARLRGRRAMMLQRDPAEAIQIWRTALRANPADAALISALVEAYYWAGDFPAAVQFLREVIRFDPLNEDPPVGLGIIYAHLGLDDRAEGAFAKAVSLAPGQPSPWVTLSMYRQVQGRLEDARAAIDSADVRGFPYAEVYLGVIDLWAGDIDEAHARFEGTALLEQALYLHMPPAAHVRLLKADTAGASLLLARAKEVVDRLPLDQSPMYAALQIPAVRGDREATAAALREYVEQGGRWSRWIRRDPVFDRVREDPEFEAELVKLEEIVDRQRRQVERDLAGVD
jgi:TolB-like protein/Tfp pilus assembly protein PilF